MGFKLPSFNLFKRKKANQAGPNTAMGLNTTMVMKGLQHVTDDKASRPLPFIGKKPLELQLKILGGAWFWTVLITFLILMWYGLNTSTLKQHTTVSTEMQMLSQRIAKGAQQAALGNPIAFAQLKEADQRFSADIKNLTKGGDGIQASSKAIQPMLAEMNKQWTEMRHNISQILAQEKNLAGLGNAVAGVNAGNIALLDLSEQLSGQLIQTGTGPHDISNARQLGMLTQRIAKNANTLLWRTEIDPEEAFLLGKDIASFQVIVSGLMNGSEALRLAPVKDVEARRLVGEIGETYQDFAVHATKILSNMQGLVEAKNAQRNLFKDGDRMLDATRKLTDTYNDNAVGGITIIVVVLVLGSFAMTFAVLFARALLENAKKRAAESEQENKRNQEAILRLLNEMGDLAEGDLTVRAGVTEDITGAIADSINYAIDELRMLVSGVNKATELVTKASSDAQRTSEQLLLASEKQSQEIQETSAAVLQMADSINGVSASAAESAKVANQSLQVADKGAQAVQNSIAGMNEIRGQIQETAKRIKRLGESSQEISEIVELISDITEQTNILALNAAIQAASAGEAGRGFTVVAEEVQRLAERSAEATKQIGAIVKTIQTDTHDAVAAMEQSTQGVVEGAKLSDAAGQALSEIEQVSRNLAGLIETISSATQAQAEAAGKVARNMQDIQDITNRTTEGTKQTATSIGQLTELAAELKGSVAGFKLS